MPTVVNAVPTFPPSALYSFSSASRRRARPKSVILMWLGDLTSTFLAARSLCTSLLSSRYIMPCVSQASLSPYATDLTRTDLTKMTMTYTLTQYQCPCHYRQYHYHLKPHELHKPGNSSDRKQQFCTKQPVSSILGTIKSRTWTRYKDPQYSTEIK